MTSDDGEDDEGDEENEENEEAEQVEEAEETEEAAETEENTVEGRFDDTASCYYMDSLESGAELTDFRSPFYTADFLLVGPAQLGNCQCNSGATSHCPPIADAAWALIHTYYSENIVPYIGDIHRDLYFRYDMWLHDSNSTLPKENVEDFAQVIHEMQEKFIRDQDYRTCLKKISPFIQRDWAASEHAF